MRMNECMNVWGSLHYDKVTCRSLDEVSGSSPGWGGALDTWANSSGVEKARGTQQQKLVQVEKRGGHGSQQERSKELPGGSSGTPLRKPCEGGGVGSRADHLAARWPRFRVSCPLLWTPHRRLAAAPRSARASAAAGWRAEDPAAIQETAGETGARSEDGASVPRAGSRLVWTCSTHWHPLLTNPAPGVTQFRLTRRGTLSSPNLRPPAPEFYCL